MSIIDKIKQKITLRQHLKVRIEMEDYDNWIDGKYYGDAGKFIEAIIDELHDLEKVGVIDIHYCKKCKKYFRSPGSELCGKCIDEIIY